MCRPAVFYVRQGCLLGEINRFAYSDPHVAHETMLIWYLDLQLRGHHTD
jgi:hypothetical protein